MPCWDDNEAAMTGETYKKAQAVWVCWRLFSHHSTTDPRSGAQPPYTVPSTFATRCRKLIEQGVGAPILPGTPGADTLFTSFQIWELAIGLTLSDLGLAQQHVGFFLRHIRESLRSTFKRIHANLPVPRSRLLARDRPNAPERRAQPGLADTDCFLVVRPVEIKEAFGQIKFDASDWTGAPDTHPLILFSAATDILFGSDAVSDRLAMRGGANTNGRSVGERGWIVVEIADAVAEIEGFLPYVPAFRRGRPS